MNYQYLALDDWHARRSTQPMLSSEAAACTCARGIYADVYNNETAHQSIWNCIKGKGCASWPTESGISMEESWDYIATREFMAGGFFWAGFDYRGVHVQTHT